MILNKKNTLAIALVAGLGLAGTAGAYTINTAGFPVLIATADIVDATTDIGINNAFTISLGDDTILGRTTGFTIRYSLDNGATFGQTVQASDFTIGTAGRFGLAGAWTASIASGGTLTDNFVVVSMNPGAPADCDLNAGTADAVCGLVAGTLLTFNAAASILAPIDGGQVLDTLLALQTADAAVTATVSFTDPVTGNAIGGMGAQSRIILKSGDPVEFACSAAAGNTAKRIDVGVSNGQAIKTYFSSNGAIGNANSNYINMGTVTATADPAFTSFDFAATDEFVTIVNGDFSAFSGTGVRDVFLSFSNVCATVDINGVIDNTNSTVTFEYTLAEAGGNVNGYSMYVCAKVPVGNTVVIDATTVTTTTTFTRGNITSDGGISISTPCKLTDLRYNGSVVEVYHVSPATNASSESFIRVINPSALTAKVTINAVDDLGVANAAPITYTLGAGMSKQINSQDMEAGNAAKGLTGAWGNGTGKWRATVTGEFPNMVVQSMNRNLTDGTVTNLTDADQRGEQWLDQYYNNQ